MTLREALDALSQVAGPDTFGALLVALTGGVFASAVCPCTLPVGIGIASAAGASETVERRRGLAVATAFFSGIVVNLTLLGAIAGHAGVLLSLSFGRAWTAAMFGLALIAAVVAFAGPRLKVRQLEQLRRPGLLGAFAYGFVFSLGTSVAPLLVLLTVSTGRGHPSSGLLLALAFGIGRGLPFLIAGASAGTVVALTRLGAWRRPVEVLSGCALLGVAAYYARAFLVLV